MKKPLKWAITILGMLAVFAVVYVCGEKFGVTAGPIPTLVLMLARTRKRNKTRSRRIHCGGSFLSSI